MNTRPALLLAPLLLLPLLLSPLPSRAQDAPAATAAMPEWDGLSSAQREALIAPLRDRWNANPAERARLLERARRWSSMPSDARERAHHGMRRFEKMSPEGRERARALFHVMRGMPAEQRKSLLERWQAMNPQQRDEWVAAHPPPQDRRRPGRD